MNTGDKIESDDDELYIQIPKDKCISGEIGSDQFRPRSKDNGKKSMDWSGKTTFEDAATYHQDAFGVTGGACTGVVADFKAEGIPIVYDPVVDTAHPNPAHCYGDYTRLGTSRLKNAGKKLKKKLLPTLVTYDT